MLSWLTENSFKKNSMRFLLYNSRNLCVAFYTLQLIETCMSSHSEAHFSHGIYKQQIVELKKLIINHSCADYRL